MLRRNVIKLIGLALFPIKITPNSDNKKFEELLDEIVAKYKYTATIVIEHSSFTLYVSCNSIRILRSKCVEITTRTISGDNYDKIECIDKIVKQAVKAVKNKAKKEPRDQDICVIIRVFHKDNGHDDLQITVYQN